MSYIVALDGVDASGKKTQAEYLYQKLTKLGYQTYLFSFPDYESPGSAPAKMYLTGKFGNRPEDVNPYIASCFFAVDRYVTFKRKWEKYLRRNCIILLDRYTSANAIHQTCKLPMKETQVEFLNWLYDFEYKKIGLPVPNLTLFLDMPPELSMYLLNKRVSESGTAKDIHEANEEYLKKCYETAHLACGLWGWVSVQCANMLTPIPAHRTHENILQIVMKFMPEDIKPKESTSNLC